MKLAIKLEPVLSSVLEVMARCDVSEPLPSLLRLARTSRLIHSRLYRQIQFTHCSCVPSMPQVTRRPVLAGASPRCHRKRKRVGVLFHFLMEKLRSHCALAPAISRSAREGPAESIWSVHASTSSARTENGFGAFFVLKGHSGRSDLKIGNRYLHSGTGETGESTNHSSVPRRGVPADLTYHFCRSVGYGPSGRVSRFISGMNNSLLSVPQATRRGPQDLRPLSGNAQEPTWRRPFSANPRPRTRHPAQFFVALLPSQ